MPEEIRVKRANAKIIGCGRKMLNMAGLVVVMITVTVQQLY